MAGYDAVIVGSGLGGLTCGACLAREGARVLVLERHSRIGGYAHSFKRRAFEFDSGIHSVPMAGGGALRDLFERLDIDNVIEPIEHRAMFSATTPSGDVWLPGSTQGITDYLASEFAHCRSEVDAVCNDARQFRAVIEESSFDFENGFPERHREFLGRFHGRTYNQYLASRVSDPRLLRTLRALWPFAGMPPGSGASVFSFMVFVMHYLEGSHYCKGGFSRLADALAGVIRRAGGSVETKCEVTGLRVAGERVEAVECANGAEYPARTFIANINPALLHGRLIPEPARSRRWLRRADNLNPSMSAVAVYLGLSDGVLERMPSRLHFWYAGDDHDAAFEQVRAGSHSINHLIMMGCSELNGQPTLLLLRFAPSGASDSWKQDKLRMADDMVACADRVVSGLRDSIQVMETGSPSTFERYTRNGAGALYGYENTASLYGEARMPTRTHLANLFQTGHHHRPGSGVWNVCINASVVARAVRNTLD